MGDDGVCNKSVDLWVPVDPVFVAVSNGLEPQWAEDVHDVGHSRILLP